MHSTRRFGLPMVVLSVPGCTRKQYGKRYNFLRENFISQVGKLTCNCDVAIFRDCLNCFLVSEVL